MLGLIKHIYSFVLIIPGKQEQFVSHLFAPRLLNWSEISSVIYSQSNWIQLIFMQTINTSGNSEFGNVWLGVGVGVQLFASKHGTCDLEIKAIV